MRIRKDKKIKKKAENKEIEQTSFPQKKAKQIFLSGICLNRV